MDRHAVSVRGPDDLIATRDYPEAVALAHQINTTIAGIVARDFREGNYILYSLARNC